MDLGIQDELEMNTISECLVNPRTILIKMTTLCRYAFTVGSGSPLSQLLLQWARDRRLAESDREGDFGPDDYFDAATRGANRGEEDVDEFGETMLLFILTLAVSALLYVRGRWVERMRREEQARQQQRQQANGAAVPPPHQSNGPLYPRPGDDHPLNQ